jgi:hypothetical protein
MCSEYEDEEKNHTIERKMQISKVDEIYCVLRYNIWQTLNMNKNNEKNPFIKFKFLCPFFYHLLRSQFCLRCQALQF